jgi:hypothetical protein
LSCAQRRNMATLTRTQFISHMKIMSVPQKTLAALAPTFKQEVSEYVAGRIVSARIEAKLIAVMLELWTWYQHCRGLGVRPDLRDVESVRSSISEFRLQRIRERGALAAADYTFTPSAEFKERLEQEAEERKSSSLFAGLGGSQRDS